MVKFKPMMDKKDYEIMELKRQIANLKDCLSEIIHKAHLGYKGLW